MWLATSLGVGRSAQYHSFLIYKKGEYCNAYLEFTIHHLSQVTFGCCKCYLASRGHLYHKELEMVRSPMAILLLGRLKDSHDAVELVNLQVTGSGNVNQ